MGEIPDNLDSQDKRKILSWAGRHGIKYSLTGGLSTASSAGLESICIASGLTAAKLNPFSHLTTEQAVAGLAASYVTWGAAIWSNYNKAWESLEETGVCISLLAKGGYEFSTWVTNQELFQRLPFHEILSRAFRRTATLVGFTTFELAKEGPWFVTAFGGKYLLEQLSPENYTPNMEIAFLTGANLAAAGYNYLQAAGVTGGLRGYKGVIRDIRERLKRDTNYRLE